MEQRPQGFIGFRRTDILIPEATAFQQLNRTLLNLTTSIHQSSMVAQEVVDVLREYIFDEMPIRLLKVPEIELLDRRAVLQLLTPRMEAITEEYIQEKSKTNWAKYLDRNILIRDCIREQAPYAILSHTWFNEEVTYEDWRSQQNLSGPGYEKLIRFCQVAAMDHGVSLAWMDTICINKESTSELDESIRSMYRWYEGSAICIISLANTSSLDDMIHDRWFTRGWTLQELLAPRRLKFYGKSWTPLVPLNAETNDKPSGSPWDKPSLIHLKIEQATGISSSALRTFKPGGDDFSERMVWAAKRVTTRGEDRAYSLMGVFSVSFPIAYGEGVERAFFRLLDQILHSYRNILELLNWAGRPISNLIHSSNILPSSPECYQYRSTSIRLQGIDGTPSWPMNLTHLGLQVRLLLVDALTPPSEDANALLSEGKVRMTCSGSLQKEPVIIHLRNTHDRDLFGPFRFTFKFVFGIWTFRESKKFITVPQNCAAFLFRVPHLDQSFLATGIDQEGHDHIISSDDEETEEMTLESCMVETTQVISFTTSDKLRNCITEKQLQSHKVLLRSVYL